RYALPPLREREPRSDDGSTSSVARLNVGTFASLQAANGVDLYKALGISSQASLPEIKVAFRNLAKALHPDRNAGDKLAEQQFAAVGEAYSILVNAEWRAIYDREVELIRAAAAAQVAEQEARRVTARRRLILLEALKFAGATVILTAAFVTGVSIWQRSPIGTPRTQMAATGAQPPRTQIPTTITSPGPRRTRKDPRPHPRVRRGGWARRGPAAGGASTATWPQRRAARRSRRTKRPQLGARPFWQAASLRCRVDLLPEAASLPRRAS